MSRTLFWYVFKDLAKIFFMAWGALAGIMSFGALLRPLTQNGLDGSQVLLLLRYFNIAMSTYSLPVAALFATTVVYGRMSADNEITACRSCGISFLSLTTPAMLLGLFVGAGSMFLLCFIVPYATLKAEQVVVSNLARLITHQIEQTHTASFGNFNIFAQNAKLLPPESGSAHDQIVVLDGPTIVQTYPPIPQKLWFRVAREFWTAQSAVAYFHENADFSSTLMVTLTDGVAFPRRFSDPKSQHGGLGAATFGPETIPSQLIQKPKFQNIIQLKELLKDPSRGQEVQEVTASFIRADQSNTFASHVADQLNGPTGQCTFHLGGAEYSVQRADAHAVLQKDTVVLVAPAGAPPITLREENGGEVRLTAEARSATITVNADTPNDQLDISIDLKDAIVDAADMPSPKAVFSRDFVLPMPSAISDMKNRTAELYLSPGARSEKDQQHLMRPWVDLVNHIRGEMHARAAFVVSCLLLVLIGAALGMMFRSGNFLTAFAVSVIPALLSIVLIVTGQHTVENTPLIVTAANDPLYIGIALIWSGNVAIFLAAFGLVFHLHRK